MEPNKLEKQFREQLNSREIKPSEMAWTKLDAMLSAAEKPKAKFPWLYVAASFAGLLLIGTVYFTFQEDTIKNRKNGVVIQNSVTSKSKTILSDSTNFKIVQKESIGQVVQKSVSKSNQSSGLRKESIVVKNQTAEISISDPFKKNDTMISSENNQSSAKNKYVSAEKLLAEVSDTKLELKVTDKTIEKNRKSISVDPNSLLSNVESELNESFRESAFDRLNKKINTIKTVLVNRNYDK